MRRRGQVGYRDRRCAAVAHHRHRGPHQRSPAEELSAQFRAAWTGFAATGDPGWPAYDARQRLTRICDMPAAVVPYPEEASRRRWQDHQFPALPLQPTW